MEKEIFKLFKKELVLKKIQGELETDRLKLGEVQEYYVERGTNIESLKKQVLALSLRNSSYFSKPKADWIQCEIVSLI